MLLIIAKLGSNFEPHKTSLLKPVSFSCCSNVTIVRKVTVQRQVLPSPPLLSEPLLSWGFVKISHTFINNHWKTMGVNEDATVLGIKQAWPRQAWPQN